MFEGFFPEIEEEFNSIWHQVKAIPGYITKHEGFLLYLFGKQCSVYGTVVEIGSYAGRSSVLLGLGILSQKDRVSNLVCVDNFSKRVSRTFPRLHNPKEEFLNNIKRFSLEQISTLREEDGFDALSSLDLESCGLIFIDGEHTRNQISREFPAAVHAINKRGIILIHDYLNESVEKGYNDWIRENVQANYSAIYFKDSTPEYRGNGLLLVESTR